MALGTLASRGTGFLRTLVLAYALGVGSVSIAYNNANTLPNTVYDLMLGGILTSIVVPLLVNAAKRDTDGGAAYDQRLFTLATVSLFALTVVATVAASLLVGLYAHSITGPERSLMVVFAYFFVPQIFFYGMSSLAGAVLNARGHFAAPMWAPVINNIVVIAVLLLFIITGGIGVSACHHHARAGATARVRHHAGHHRADRGADPLPAEGRLPVAAQIRLPADARSPRPGGWRARSSATSSPPRWPSWSCRTSRTRPRTTPGTHGFPAYSYAWLLFQLPYAIVGISVITALLPRMSAHASEEKYSLVKSDFSGGVRLSSVIVVPAALVLAVLGAPLAEALFGYGSTSVAEARYIGMVFGIFSLGLVPYMMFQLMLRVFYAMHDSRTPMYIGVAVMATNIAASLLSLAVLPAGHVVEGVAAAFGLANVVGTVLSWRILSHRLHGLAGKQIAASLSRMHLAAIPSLLFALAATSMIGVILPPGPAYGIVTVIIGGGGALLLYLLFARALRITEVTELTSGLRNRLGR